MTAAVDRELADYKQVASDLRVGVNHLALDEERLRQEQFLQGLLDLQHRIFEDENLKQHYSEEIEDLKNGIRLNADVLSYLKRVTKLEGPLTELTNKVNEAAIAASSPSAATPAVFANKALTENVNNCWEYIAQLSAITQAHLKDAASYQQFHHMANEVDAHIDKMIGLAEMKMLLFDPQGTVDEAVLLAKELEGDHIELARTWEQTCQLTEMARHLKPIQNRLARVVCGRTVDTSPEMAQNIVMVKALISFSGPDFAIRKGEEMILMKNENPNFWSVKTTFGEREVPSVIFSTVGPNQAEVFKANSLQRKCVSDWKRVLERNKGRLVKYYTKLFEQYCQNEAIYFAHEDAMNDFLDDLDSILIASNYDSGILHRAYEKFTNTLMLLSPNRRPPRGAISLTEQDIRALHAPLRRVLNQAVHVDQVQSRVSMSAEEVQRYLKSVEDERQNIFNEISRMEQLQKEKENQLKSLQQRMISWKTKRQAYDRAIGDYNLEPMEDIMKSFPSTPFAKLRVVENDYGSGGNQYEMNLDEASSSETQSSSYYGKVAKQIVTSHNRSKANGVTFVGEVVKDGEGGGKVWSGNAAILKRSASTNDLQTQILRVTMNTGVQYNQEDHRLAFADISELRKNDQTISTADVQSQILRVTRNATSQVGVRVTPKAIDLSRVDIGNLGLEVLNNKETEGLGFRVGEVLCPVSVGTSVNLYEGPGVQVLGINDVDSLNLELRNAVAHATKDSHRGLKIRDVQSQIITRASNESAWSETQASSEVQTQIGVMNRTAAIQAVAKMEVVNIPSYRQKSRLAEGTSTNFCLLPDKKSTGTMNSEAATSDVMTQISCILHSRGIHSDLQTYLSEYKKRSSLSETTDLGEQSPNVAFQPKSEIRSSTATCDVETLISRVVHDYGTQVSSRLIPTEVTVSKISAKNMAVSLSNPLKEIEIGLPIDSLICPSDMKFQTELYEGSDLSIADYSGVSNFIVKHGDGVVTGSMHLSSVDMQTHHDRGLKTQAAVVLRASKVGIGEVTAQSGVAPKVNFVISNVAGRPFHDSKTPTSDLQTQIRSSNLPREDGGKSQELIESEAEFIRKNENISVEYSTPGNKFEVGQESLNFAKEFLCVKCQRKYREISSQVEKTIPERNDLQTNISQIVTSKGIQQESNDMQYSEYSCRKRLVSSEVQVGLELVPTQISMKKYDIEKMEVEFLDATENENYNVKMNSVSCPARIKVESRLTEGSGVHISGIEKASRVVISVSGSLPSVRTDVTEKIEDEGPDISYEEFKTEVNFVHTSGSMAGRKLYSSKSTQRNLIRLIPCGVAGCKVKTSSETSQVLSVTSDASMQVGSRLVPLAIGVSPVQLENMEISLTNLGKAMSGETSLASALLYPAQVELQSSLVDGQSGIELIPIEQLEYINMNTSRSEAMVQYSSSTSDVITQIITPEKPNLLPASIVLETGQFDGHHRIPNIASQSLVCDLFSNRMRNQTITIRAKPATSNYSSEKPLSYLGYVSTEAHTQTADTSMENMKEESNSAADIPHRGVKQNVVGVQVGTKLIPEVLKLAQIPVKNMKLESSFSSPGHQESISLQSVRCPAEIAMKSELCDDSGIVICSLDQSGEIEVEMACDSPEPQIVTKEQFTNKTNKVHGWWSGIISGKTPIFENKSLENSTARKSAENAIATSKKPIRIENNLSLQGEAILQPETYTNHPNPRYKLVMVDSANQSKSTSQRNSISPDKQYSSVSASKLNWSDRGVQVGVKLIPNSIDVRPLKLENMKAVLSSKTTRGAREVDVSAVLCTSGVQYGEELTETTGVQVVQINESAELSLCYCGDKFVTSVVSANKGASVIGSTDGSKHFDVDSITARNVDPNTTPDVDDSNFITILRVKEAQYSTGDKRTAGYWEGTKTPNGEITFVQNRTHPVDKSVQVGLDLIPKTVTVEKVSVENMEVVSGQRKHDNFEQVSVGAMLYSRPTQYDQILTESKGVRVLPIRDTQDVQMEYNGEKFYTSVDSSRDFIEASYSESRNDRPRLRVHHLEFSDEVGHIESINRIKESPKVEAMTQVGAVLVPTELKLEKMSLDARQVPRLVESISTENILCPTEIAASSMLSECSGVHITSIGGLSEIALRLGQAEYKAEVQQDIKSNQTRIAIKERSISAKRSHASGYVSLIEPSPSALAFGEITNSTLHSLSSKSVQVGTILIPTAVTMEKVMVENLEVSVPLNQSRSAEVNVSAVLASSATEMTTVLTNASGIHVIPMSKVDEIGIQANGKSYIGMVEGAHQSAYSRTPSSTSTIQDQQKIVLPIASSTISGNANIEASLLQQSADLSLLHNALRSGQTTPVLRETNTFSTGSFRRPGIIHIPGQTLTPITEISSTTPHSAPKDVMDSSVQVGVRLIPNSISVQRVNKKQEIEFHNFLLSSEFQYEMMLQETVGVDVVPMKYAGKVNVMLEGDNFTSEIGSMRSDRRYASLDKSRDLLERASSTPSVMRCNQGTQVGAILLPQHLNLERMNLKSGSVNSAAILNESRTQSVLYPTNIGVDVTLSENPGLQMADFGGEVLVDFGDSSYNAKVSRTASSAEASVHLIDRSVSRGRKSSILEISLSRNRSVTPVTSTSGEMVRRYTVSTSTQVGTVLIPTKVCMTQVDVENLAVEIPLTEWKSTDLNVSAILASTGTEMMTVLSEDTGIQVVDMKDLDELGIQCGDEVYVAGVTASKPKYISDTYGPSRDYNVTSSTSNKRREVIFISVPKKLENSQLNQKATNLLNQSGDLREIHSTLSSSVSQPRLLMKSVFGTPIRFNGPLSSQQLMTARAPQPPTMICDCGRQYTVAEIERQLISMESGTIGESGRVNSRFSTNKPMRQMAASYNTYASQDGQSGIRCSCGRHLAALTACSQPVETSCSACGRRNVEVVGGLEGMTIFTCDCGRQYASGDISKLPITLPCSSCGSVDTVVVDMISSQTRGYESYHVTCEAAIKPAMVSKRLTVKIQPVGIDVGCQVGTYEMDCSVDTRLSRNQLSQLTTHDMTSELMNTPNLLRRTPSKKRTHSEESHGRHRTANICSFCRSRVMITDISTADPDDPNSYEASIRIRRVSNDDTNDNSVSTNLSRGSTLRRSFFTRGSDKRSSGSFESLRSHSVASKCVICRNEITSGDLSSSIRTSTSSLLGGGGGAVAAVGDSRVHEIADAYAQICRETDRFDGGKANLYSMLKSNKIIQTVINDYEREKHFEEGRHFAEGMEIVEIVSTNDNAMGKARSGDKAIYSQLRHNFLTQRVIDSYECYKHSMRVDEFIQVTSNPVQGEVGPVGDEIQEIIDVVNALKDAERQVGGKTIYSELKGNAIIQRVIKEYEVSRLTHATIPRPSTSSRLMDVVSSRDSKVGILSVDGQIAKMEFEQFTTSDLMGRRSVSIFQRHNGTESKEKPLSSSVSSVSGDEDTTGMWRTSEEFAPTSIRYDVAVSALITPETWDKKVQFDSSNPR